MSNLVLQRINYPPGTVIGPVVYIEALGKLDAVRWSCCGGVEVVARTRLAQLKRGKIKRCLTCYRKDSGRINWAARRGEDPDLPPRAPRESRYPPLPSWHPFAILTALPVSPGLRRDIWGNPAHA